MNKMTKETQELATKIFSLALEINDTETCFKKTNHKPTIFIEFAGHTAQIDVRIHKNGWASNEIGEDETQNFIDIYLEKNPTEKLKAIINKLEEIKKEWC